MIKSYLNDHQEKVQTLMSHNFNSITSKKGKDPSQQSVENVAENHNLLMINEWLLSRSFLCMGTSSPLRNYMNLSLVKTFRINMSFHSREKKMSNYLPTERQFQKFNHLAKWDQHSVKHYLKHLISEHQTTQWQLKELNKNQSTFSVMRLCKLQILIWIFRIS